VLPTGAHRVEPLAVLVRAIRRSFSLPVPRRTPPSDPRLPSTTDPIVD
jgi:hypothetical protein